MKNKIFLAFLTIIYSILAAKAEEKIDLSGTWYYRLGKAPVEIPGEGEVVIPGTLDTNRKGIPVKESDNTTRLSRRYTYSGDVSYTKTVTIPQSWEGKPVELFIERTRPTVVKVDGELAGYCNRISSPHRYDLTGLLTPGIHEIEITVNNLDSIPASIRTNSNSASEYTQTNWNGMTGRIYLEALDPYHITSLEFEGEPGVEKIKINAGFSMPVPSGYSLAASINPGGENKIMLSEGDEEKEIFLDVKGGFQGWNHLQPKVYELEVSLIDPSGRTVDTRKMQTGLKTLTATDSGFQSMGIPVFLRGTTDSAVFPMTGYPPSDEASWEEYFTIIKNYGLNHVRFHSWCPPEAAFNVADRMGIYLQIELPVWGELDRELTKKTDFLKEDLTGILDEYSSHPSFALFSTGNELWGDISLIQEFVEEVKETDSGILATLSSDLYSGMYGQMEGEDFIVASRLGRADDRHTDLRGSFSYADRSDGGRLNSENPDNRMNYSSVISRASIPVISHETGQYQSYPDFTTIESFCGVLRADNLKEFQRRAQEAGVVDKSEAFHLASSKFASDLYRREMESLIFTPGMGGFQLMSLQDYPGQGTALVGAIDAFMQPKAAVDSNIWRMSCSDLVITASLPKFTFTSGEDLLVALKAANFTGVADTIKNIIWSVGFDSGEVKGMSTHGISEIGRIRLRMPEVKSPKRYDLTLEVADGVTLNSYPVWVYPRNTSEVKGVYESSDLEETLRLLEEGKKVLFTPDSATVARASLPGSFVTDFWNYRMFRTIADKMGSTPPPGTLGLLIDKSHPALSLFPTESYTESQWFTILKNSRPLIIDRLPGDIEPIVEVIDNAERSYRLALVLECNVGKGKLMIMSADMNQIMSRPEGAWFRQSLLEYMASKDFRPRLSLTLSQVENLITKPSNSRMIKELKNEVNPARWE